MQRGTRGRTYLAMTLAAALVLVAATSWGDDTLQWAQRAFKPLPATTPNLRGNVVTPAKVELGKNLFFDPRLSASQLISCNTCHNLALGGVDLQETSIGHGWQKGPRNAPTVFNAVYNIAQFWDGRAEDLKAQAKGPVEAAVEMNNKPAQVVAVLKSIPGYARLFKEAFPGQDAPITYDNVARAIEAFEATLTTPDAPFDRYLKGERKALTEKQEQGLAVFLDKGCVACHGGVNIGGRGYYPFGVVKAPGTKIRPANDTGRYKVTKTSSDNYVFRSPTLRNVAFTAPYFHSGKVWKLSEAVAVMGTTQLGTQLDSSQVAAVVAFLGTLNGAPPQVQYPVLPPSAEGTPQPVLRVGERK